MYNVVVFDAGVDATSMVVYGLRFEWISEFK